MNETSTGRTIAQAERTIRRLDAKMDSGRRLSKADLAAYDAATLVFFRREVDERSLGRAARACMAS